jgi:DNA-binding CsgD family transcriptional regulator
LTKIEQSNQIYNAILNYSQFLSYLKDNQQIDFLYQDSLRNLWYCADRKLGVLRHQKDGSYRNFVSLFSKVSNFLVPTYLHVNELDLNDVLIGIEGGYVHYVSKFNKDYMLPEAVFISELKSRDTSEGIYRYNSSTKVQSIIPAFKYRNNTISIAFSTNNFESPGKDFQYKLIGFDKDWSEWTSQTFKEYTNLPAGEYTFALNARNNDQMQPSRLSYKFNILPPWYLTWYALILYVILFMISIFLVQRYFKYRMEKSRLAENQKQKEKALLAEKEMEHLRNEKLNLEVIHKEKELANSTMQLIHKNKILNKLKTDLLNSVSSHGEVVPKTNVNSLIKRIDKEIDNEKQWQVFDMHVEQVYENLFKNLKDQYPDLTPRELSLCAYLRMNISSKEIATLMNISARGVEISRYRIRKKLRLEHDANLTEFMMKF